LVLVVITAAGGILGAGVFFVGYLRLGDEASVLESGWPIVCATGVGFTYLIARTCSTPARSFLLPLCIVSNAIGLLLVEFRYPTAEVHHGGSALIAGAIIVAAVMSRRGIKSFWPYLLGCGSLSWCGLFLLGLHPALALVPIVPFLKGTSRHRSVVVAQKIPLQVVLFLFGLTNAGVVFRSIGTGTWAVAVAVLAGKPAGMLLAVSIAAAAGLRLPRDLGWRDLAIIAGASATGVTVGLFFATATFPVGPVLNEVKLGILVTGGMSLLMIAAASLPHVGRFAKRDVRRSASSPPLVGTGDSPVAGTFANAGVAPFSN
jgi:NhaA family Na+:H+ antiporter